MHWAPSNSTKTRPILALALSLILHAALYFLSDTGSAQKDSIDSSNTGHSKIRAYLGENNRTLPPDTAHTNLIEADRFTSAPSSQRNYEQGARTTKTTEQPDATDQRTQLAKDVEATLPAFDFQPDYPLHLLSSGIRGSVSVAFNLRRSGAIENIEILASTPPGVFDKAVIDAIVAAEKAAPNRQSALGRRYVIVVDFDPNGTLSQSRTTHEK